MDLGSASNPVSLGRDGQVEVRAISRAGDAKTSDHLPRRPMLGSVCGSQVLEDVVLGYCAVREFQDCDLGVLRSCLLMALLCPGTSKRIGRGRNAGYPAPPAQIPACGTTALGSCLGSDAKAPIGIRLHDPRIGQPTLDEPFHPLPVQPPSLAAS